MLEPRLHGYMIYPLLKKNSLLDSANFTGYLMLYICDSEKIHEDGFFEMQKVRSLSIVEARNFS